MNKVMTRQQVRSYDKQAIEKFAVPSVILMENAGRGCADIIKQRYKIKDKVLIFCGSGNNGGDGYVTSRHLTLAGINNRCFILADREKISGDADTNLRILEKTGADIKFIKPENVAAIKEDIDSASLIVDAIFGTGLNGDIRDNYIQLFNAINSSKAPVFAVDIPSGLDCDTGKPLNIAIKADATATFAAIKKGFENPQSAAYTGEVFVAHIGI